MVILWLSWGHIGIMENKMETTVVYWGYTGERTLEMRVLLCQSSQPD